MFRKRRRPTPNFKIPSPYHPIQGESANLRQDGTSPFCAMFQVAAEDTYDDYVICRGFDPRILRFIDYEEGNANKPGVSVAKPYGKRVASTYMVGEVYPAFLPTQGNANYQDFRQVVFVPPSPVAVEWRVGQNPGKVTGGGGEGGQPEELTDTIEILYDHNGKAVNWLLIDSSGGSGSGVLHATVDSLSTAGTSSPYNGLVVASCTVTVAPCDRSSLIGTSVDIVDHEGCWLDLTEAQLTDVAIIAAEGVAQDLSSGASPGDLTPCHWTAINRCCTEYD